MELLRAKLLALEADAEDVLVQEENRPDRACSVNGGADLDTGELCDGSDDASHSKQTSCDKDSDARREFFDGSLAPVQPVGEGGLRGVLAEVSPNRELYPRKLNRKQRRARQRKLEKLRQKSRV
jgi:hypothetical protein